MKFYLCIVSTLFFLSLSALADQLPYGCVYGESNEPEGFPDAWYKLDLHSPEFALLNQPTRLTVEGPKGLLSDKDEAKIYSLNATGPIGTTQLGFWDGKGTSDVVLKDLGLNVVFTFHRWKCSKDDIIVQNAPTIEVFSYNSSAGTVTISYSYDGLYSKAARSGTSATIIFEFVNDLFGNIVTAKYTAYAYSAVVTIPLAHLQPGDYTVRVSLFDGTFKSPNSSVGTYSVPGRIVQPCPTCFPR